MDEKRGSLFVQASLLRNVIVDGETAYGELNLDDGSHIPVEFRLVEGQWLIEHIRTVECSVLDAEDFCTVAVAADSGKSGSALRCDDPNNPNAPLPLDAQSVSIVWDLCTKSKLPGGAITKTADLEDVVLRRDVERGEPITEDALDSVLGAYFHTTRDAWQRRDWNRFDEGFTPTGKLDWGVSRVVSASIEGDDSIDVANDPETVRSFMSFHQRQLHKVLIEQPAPNLQGMPGGGAAASLPPGYPPVSSDFESIIHFCMDSLPQSLALKHGESARLYAQSAAGQINPVHLSYQLAYMAANASLNQPASIKRLCPFTSEGRLLEQIVDGDTGQAVWQTSEGERIPIRFMKHKAKWRIDEIQSR